jgi:hypothetical protein
LQRLEYAAAKPQWQVVDKLAQCIREGCLQLVCNDAATAIAKLGRIPSDWFIHAFVRRQPVIRQPVIAELLSHI